MRKLSSLYCHRIETLENLSRRKNRYVISRLDDGDGFMIQQNNKKVSVLFTPFMMIVIVIKFYTIELNKSVIFVTVFFTFLLS